MSFLFEDDTKKEEEEDPSFGEMVVEGFVDAAKKEDEKREANDAKEKAEKDAKDAEYKKAVGE
jgi:hypothetical protein